MATTVLGKLAKRRCYPVKIDGEDVHVRALSYGEIRALESMPPELAVPFIFGCGLVSDTGDRAIPQLEGESYKDFAGRVGDILTDRDVPSDNIRDVNAAVTRLMHVPLIEDIAKNS